MCMGGGNAMFLLINLEAKYDVIEAWIVREGDLELHLDFIKFLMLVVDALLRMMIDVI